MEKPRPVGVASDVRMVYTDSMNILAILTTKKHIDYTNLTFKYSEFPPSFSFFTDIDLICTPVQISQFK